jgi:hypothetical protein
VSRQRSSVKFAKSNLIFRAHRERIARDIAFEAGASLQEDDDRVLLHTAAGGEPLCAESRPAERWRLALAALCARYPHLARQS